MKKCLTCSPKLGLRRNWRGRSSARSTREQPPFCCAVRLTPVSSWPHGFRGLDETALTYFLVQTKALVQVTVPLCPPFVPVTVKLPPDPKVMVPQVVGLEQPEIGEA
jgi:hypothetical protein